MTTKIQARRNTSGWTAFFGSPGRLETGLTRNEAIGRLVVTYGSELGIEVEDGEQEDNAIFPRPLSPREMDVLRSLLELRTYPEIGEHLGIAMNTVSRHAQAIYQALGIAGRGDLLPLIAEIENRYSRKAKGVGA